MDFIGSRFLLNINYKLRIINIHKTEKKLLNAVASYFIEIANKSIEKHNEFNVALSGGHSPQKLYELLASPEYNTQTSWTKVNFFFGDERYVPADDPQRNSYMIKKSLFDPLQIPQSNIFSIDTSLTPEESAKKYTQDITDHFKQKPISFDLILLGLGENSHTASLFPYTSVLAERSASFEAVFLKAQKSYRLTMTATLINQSKHIAFLVYGKEKAEAVQHVLEDGPDVKKYPAQLIQPLQGELQWFLDEAAASLIKN